MDSVLTLNDVSKALGVTVLTVKRWKQRGCRELHENPYHIPTVRHWRETGENIVPENDDAGQLRIDKLKADIAFTDTKKQLAEPSRRSVTGRGCWTGRQIIRAADDHGTSGRGKTANDRTTEK